MTDKPIQHVDEDGSIYSAEIVPPKQDEYDAKYHVDLVRTSVDDYGLEREQRLTIGQYNSTMEAEEHLFEVEEVLEKDGIVGWKESADKFRGQPFQDDVSYMTAVYPPDALEGHNSTAQILAVSENGIASATLASGERESMEKTIDQIDILGAEEGMDRLLQAAQVEAEVNGGKPPTTPLFDRDNGAVHHIDGSSTSHWFAIAERDISDDVELYELRYFRAMEMDDGTRHSDSYPVMPLPDDDPGAAWPLPGLEMYLQKGDVYMAQQFAHDVADSYGQDFPEPHELPAFDPRPEYYFGYGIGPSNSPSLEAVKTWMDGAERRFDTLTVGEYGSFDEAAVDEHELETVMDEKGLETAMNLAESMAAAADYLDPARDDPRIFFDDSAPPDMFMTNRQRELNIPSYGLGAISANGESFLDVVKSWGEDGYERLVIPQPDWETAQENADVAGTMLEEGRLQDAMRLVEIAGIEAGVIDPERDDSRLFTQGPADLFETIREADIYMPDLANDPYWRLETLPVNDPDGEPLGHSLHMVVYDGVEHDPERVGSPEIPESEPFRMLEMAHFETTEAADKFGKEFSGYLMPGLLEGPELAVEVARLEGHPVDWKILEGQELADYRDLKLTLTRGPADWQPYNPHAERDARIEAEGLYIDPISKYTTFDEEEDDPKVESAIPDFDL